jgi:hypothetical protein
MTFWYGPDTIDPPLEGNVADAPPPLKTQFGALLPAGVGVGAGAAVAVDVGVAVGVGAGEDDPVGAGVAVTMGTGPFEDDPLQAERTAVRATPAAAKRKSDPERACTSASVTTSEFGWSPF